MLNPLQLRRRPQEDVKFEMGEVERWLTLAGGLALLILSNGRFAVPTAAWLAPIFLLRFMRYNSPRRGSLLVYGVLLVGFIVMWRGWIPVPAAAFYLMAVGISLFQLLPFLADRLLQQRLPPFAATFVLPTATVGINYVIATFSPYGSWGDIAYSQTGVSELTQLLSVTGVHGVTFLLYWFAATVVSAWEDGFDPQRCYRRVLFMLGCLGVVFTAGGLRYHRAPSAETVRVAAIVSDQRALYEAIATTGFDLHADTATPEAVRALIEAHHNDLFSRSEREAAAGAKIIVWAEGDGLVRRPEEAALLKRAAALSTRYGVYLIAAVATVTPGKALVENKLVTFDPSGAQVGVYVKSKIVPGDANVAGDGDMLVLDTKYGRIAQAICFDMDFPAFARQAGAAGADIIIAPSSDWQEIDPYHSLMASFRGVENGASVVRPTHRGRSLVSDAQGRILAQTDHFQTAPHTLVANVPTQGVATLYARFGDWVAWLSIIVLAGLTLLACQTATSRLSATEARAT